MRSTLEDIQKLEAVAERDIDLLFIEELSISKSFRSWIYGMVWETNDHDLPFLGAWHSLIHSEYGESDIPAIFKDSHDHKTAILIENKIDALAQPNQAARYRSRGDAGIEKAWWHKYRTCIIAPEAYLNSNTEAEHYDVRISYESVKSWVWQGSPDIRNRYRAEVMENAIVQSRRVSKVLPMRCLLTSSSLLNDARCFLRSCDMSRSSSREPCSCARIEAPKGKFLRPRNRALFGLGTKGRQYLLRSNGQVGDPDSHRVLYRVGDGRSHRRYRVFANRFALERPVTGR